jgi:hypothetical protein
MANTFAHDKMCTLWEETAETTGMKTSLSKDLNTYDMDSDANKDRAADASDNGVTNGNDREYIPQEYRFTPKDGIVSSESDFEDLVDRMIPVNRGRAKRVLAEIDVKGLRDPTRRSNVAKGFARDIANVVDLDCYQTMINESTMAVTNTGDFGYQQAIDAEVLMLNYGLGAYDKKLFLSNKDYAKVAKDLGQNQYYGRDGLPADALTKAKIPDLATFGCMRSDYLLNLAGNATAGLTVNGAQEHTVATYDANGFYLDNRYMTLNITGATTANMPVGTKFTIAGVNFVHPETRQDTGELLTLTVKVAANGNPTVSPALVATGSYRNASAAAADSAAITILNKATSAPSLFYTPESTVIVPGRLPIPTDAGGVTSVDSVTEQGLPMRLSYWYDPHNEKFKMKALVYYDVQVVYNNQIGAILSNQT